MAAAHQRIRRNRRYARALPAPRVFRDRMDPLSYSDEELFERYRFRRPTILYIHEELRFGSERETKRNMALSLILSLILCLRFLATGASQLLIGDSLHISRNAAGREIRAVTSLIIRAFRRVIIFPVGEMAHKVMEGFRKIAGVHVGLILGDSGYSCTRYLMTRYNAPMNEAQENFNRS
ncbi:uncharacterized protein LOC133181987 [Saccostrea echinata]|uniref:uncharacterized protein LOC133181987 n=1 Tax=Saccostrea echinata TaxID=191078 RepID=UPI002A801FE2|nr:uncharacterized protein LOC133181987 [Saccostrea echinata]